MTAWFIDRLLPGLVTAAIVTAGTWVSHVRLRRHVTRTTEAQTTVLTGTKPTGGADEPV